MVDKKKKSAKNAHQAGAPARDEGPRRSDRERPASEQVEVAAADAAPAIAATEQATYNWTDVLRRIGQPTQEDLDLYQIELQAPALLDKGTQIASSKILTDLLRWLGRIADDVARGGDSLKVTGFSIGLLRVAARDGGALRDLLSGFEEAGGAQEQGQVTAAAAAAKAIEQGLSTRKTLTAALRAAANADPAMLEIVDTASGRSTKPAATLARAITALVKIARDALHDTGKPGKRLTNGGLTLAQLDAAEALAATVKSTGERASGARVTIAVTQGDLDRQDGICLTHMEHLIDLWDAGAASGLELPRLDPISTRSYFVHPRAKTKEPTNPTVPGAPS